MLASIDPAVTAPAPVRKRLVAVPGAASRA